MRLQLAFLTLLYALTACLDGHDNKTKYEVGGENATQQLTVKTLVAGDKFKVELQGQGNPSPLLFEVDESLLFSRLVYTKDKHVCVAKNRLTVAGGAVKEECYDKPIEVAFIKACVELEKQAAVDRAAGKETANYRLTINDNTNTNTDVACGTGDKFTDIKQLPVSELIGDAAEKDHLPANTKFSVEKIMADNLRSAIDKIDICQGNALIFESNYTCACKSEEYEAFIASVSSAVATKVMAMFNNSQSCTERSKAYLLISLAKSTRTGGPGGQ